MANITLHVGVQPEDSYNKFKKEIQALATEISKEFKDIKVSFDNKSINTMKSQISELIQSLSKLESHKIKISADNNLSELISSNINTLSSVIESIDTNIQNLSQSLSEITKRGNIFGNIENSATDASNIITRMNEQLESLKSVMSGFSGININLGGSNSVDRQRQYGISARNAISEMKSQAAELESFYSSIYKNSQNGVDAVVKAARGTDVWKKNDIFEIVGNLGDTSASLTKQMNAWKQWINIMEEVAKVKNLDISGITSNFSKSAAALENDAVNISNGSLDMDNNLEKIKSIFGSGSDLSEIIKKIDEVKVAIQEVSLALKDISLSDDSFSSLTVSINSVTESVNSLRDSLSQALSQLKDVQNSATKGSLNSDILGLSNTNKEIKEAESGLENLVKEVNTYKGNTDKLISRVSTYVDSTTGDKIKVTQSANKKGALKTSTTQVISQVTDNEKELIQFYSQLTKCNNALGRFSLAEKSSSEQSNKAYENLKNLRNEMLNFLPTLSQGVVSFEQWNKILQSWKVNIAENSAVLQLNGDSKKTISDTGEKTAADDVQKLIQYYQVLNQSESALKRFSQAQQGTDQSVQAAYDGIANQINEMRNFIDTFESGSLSAEEWDEKIKQAKLSLAGFSETIKRNVSGVEVSPNNTNNYNKLYILINKCNSALQRFSAAEHSSTQSSINAYKAIKDNVSILKQLEAECKAGSTTLGDYNKQIKDVETSLKLNTAIIQDNGDATKSFSARLGGAMSKFSNWLAASQGVMYAVNAMRKMVSTTIELDTAMTELKKVTDESDAAYSKFLDDASSRANNLGVSLSDVVNSTADFARLGYSMSEASQLSDVATIYKNVGDGIENVSEASESIIATMQAFGIQAKDAMSIVDKFNAVGNNYAISSKGVGDALLRSAAAMKSAGNTLDETIALAAAANTVVQDPEKVGTTLKTISMFLRAAKTEAEDAGESTDGMANSVSELRGEILKLTGNKVDIQIDENNFKSTYQILKELSGVWKDLSDVSKANILEMVGGKRNANVVAALLENFSVAENAVQTSADSANSAIEENEKYLNSVQGKLNQMKATFQTVSKDFVSSDLLKGLASFANAILNIIDAAIKGINYIGGLKTVLVAVGGILTAKKLTSIVSIFTKFFGSIQSKIKGVISITKNLWKAFNGNGLNEGVTGIKGVVSEVKAVNSGLKITGGILTGITTALTIIMSIYSAIKQKQEDRWNADINSGDEAAEEAKNVLELYNAYIQASEAYDKGTGSKEDLTSATESLLKQFGKEKSDIDDLTEKYGNLSEAMKATTKESLEKSLGEVKNKTVASKEKLQDTVSNGITYNSNYNSLTSPATRDAMDAIKVLQEKMDGFGEYIVDMEGLVIPLGKDNESFEGITEIYNKLVQMRDTLQDVYSAEDLTSNSLYKAIDSKLSSFKEDYETAKAAIDSQNEIAAQLLYMEKVNSDNMPKSIEDINNLEASLISAAKESKNFEGSQEDIKNAIESVLKSAPELSSIYAEAAEAQAKASSYTGYETFDISQYSDDIDKIQEKAKSLQDTLESLKDGSITSSELIDFAQEYGLEQFLDDIPELQNQIEKLLKTNPDDLIESLIELRNNVDRTDAQKITNLIVLLRQLGYTAGDISTLNAELKKVEETIKDQEDLVDELQDKNKEIKNSFDSQIDNIVKNLENENKPHQKIIDKLEDENDSLEYQNELLQEEIDKYDEIIEKYETSASTVQNYIDKQVDALESRKQAIEDEYNARIDKINNENDALNETINLEEKLNNLRNAKRKKVRIYNEQGGWQLGEDTSAIQSAEKEYRDAVTDKKVSDLEKKRDNETQGLDDKIKKWEDYAKKWSDVVDEINGKQDELTTSEILGSNWREQITKKDTSLITKFSKEYNKYKNNLKTNVEKTIKTNNENIKSNERVIKNEQSVIDENDKLIESWNEYKENFDDFVDRITDKNETYTDSISNVALTEKSTYNDRAKYFSDYTTAYCQNAEKIAAAKRLIKSATESKESYEQALENYGKYNSDTARNTVSTLRDNMNAHPSLGLGIYQYGSDIPKWMDGTALAQDINKNKWQNLISQSNQPEYYYLSTHWGGGKKYFSGDFAWIAKSKSKSEITKLKEKYDKELVKRIISDEASSLPLSQSQKQKYKESNIKSYTKTAKTVSEFLKGRGLGSVFFIDDKKDTGIKYKKLSLKDVASFSSGGVIDFTSYAKVHGTSQKSEVIFNAAQAKKLYDLVASTNNLSSYVGEKLTEKLSTNTINNIVNKSGTSNNIVIKVDKIVTPNANDFMNQMTNLIRQSNRNRMVGK